MNGNYIPHEKEIVADAVFQALSEHARKPVDFEGRSVLDLIDFRRRCARGRKGEWEWQAHRLNGFGYMTNSDNQIVTTESIAGRVKSVLL